MDTIPHNQSDKVKLERDIPASLLPQDHNLIIYSIEFWIKKARTKYHLTSKQLPMPLLSYDLRGNTLGIAHSNVTQGFFKVELNPTYCEYNAYQCRNETIPHEVCHLVTHVLHPYKGIKPHGLEWQNVCLDLGHTPNARVCTLGFKRAEEEVTKAMLRNITAEDF